MPIGVREHFLFKEKEKGFQGSCIPVTGPVPPGLLPEKSAARPVYRVLLPEKSAASPVYRVLLPDCRKPAKAQKIPAHCPVHWVLLSERSVSSPVYRVLLPDCVEEPEHRSFRHTARSTGCCCRAVRYVARYHRVSYRVARLSARFSSPNGSIFQGV